MVDLRGAKPEREALLGSDRATTTTDINLSAGSVEQTTRALVCFGISIPKSHAPAAARFSAKTATGLVLERSG